MMAFPALGKPLKLKTARSYQIVINAIYSSCSSLVQRQKNSPTQYFTLRGLSEVLQQK